MLTRLEKAKSNWGGAHSVIDIWLQERQELLVLYCKLAGLPPFQRDDQALPQKSEILEFCQLLMDYVSAGHFEIYGNIVSVCAEQGPKSLKLAQSLYPKISDSTDIALKFNDNYVIASEVNLLPEFDNDLSSLGQSLEQRFEMEDELIENLHTNHS